MMIQILKSKLHRAIITEVHLDYEGSCAIDEELLEAASINEYEMIHIYNLNNGIYFPVSKLSTILCSLSANLAEI